MIRGNSYIRRTEDSVAPTEDSFGTNSKSKTHVIIQKQIKIHESKFHEDLIEYNF